MSRKEIDRLCILKKVQDGQVTQLKAAEILNLSDRQVRNLLKAFGEFGPEGIISKKRNAASNRKLNPALKSQILRMMSTKYEDFGPTLAVEKLLEHEKLRISRETLRKWMIECQLWIPKVKRRKIHLLRKRREHFGEMLQGDGSPHDWFGNGKPCTLIYFIDDATNRITSATFEISESLFAYFEILKQQINQYGRPVSIYTDRFSVFETACEKENLTQFQRALKRLDIQWIGANSPQAKGRIERCNRTLQDRLVKEMRLRKVTNIEEGNQFLKEYLPIFNKKFSKEPMKSCDLHRPLERGFDTFRTLSKYEERTLTKDLTFQFHNTHYRIFEPIKGFCIGKVVEIRTDRNKDLRVFMGDRELEFRRLDEIYEKPNKIIESRMAWPTKRKRPLNRNHPFKNPSYQKFLKEKAMKSFEGV